MLLAVVGLSLLLQVAASSDVTYKYSNVASHVKQASNPDVIPILDNEDAPLTVTLGVSLININYVDRDRNQVDLLLWLSLSWQNKALAWDREQNGFNVTSVNVPADYLWLPDITIYDAIANPESTSPRIAFVDNSGLVYWVPSLRLRVPCNLERLDSEQGANCTIKFGSWTYSGELLTISSDSNGNIEGYIPNPKYEIPTIDYFKTTTYYPCCPEPYEDFKFSFLIRSAQEANEAAVIDENIATLIQ